jgi:hypothetical protein
MAFFPFRYPFAPIFTLIMTVGLWPSAGISAQSFEQSIQPSLVSSSSRYALSSSAGISKKSKPMTNLASATQRPNFSGTWMLDPKASDSVDEILKAQGANFIERQGAKGAKITQQIQQDASQMTITVKSPVKTTTEVLKLDGTPMVSQTDRLGNVKTKTTWGTDNTTLISVVEPTEADAKFKTLKLSRTLQDQGKTMNQLIEMTLKDGKVLKANRVFRKS